MNYALTGSLIGFHCADCSSPLQGVKVKVYQAVASAEVTTLAVATEKETFHQRSAEELRGLAERLLAEAETDDKGNFTVTLSDEQYRGGAVDIDFECGNVPIKLPTPPKHKGPFQFNITTLQPVWRTASQDQDTVVAVYRYALPARWLCRIYALFDTWVVCGTVTDCASQKPLEGLKVLAFDVDWLQDDELGSAFTDSNGKFRIVYDGDQFRKTLLSPWLNVEWPAGPDYFFRIESASGEVLLSEDRSVGHQRDRENAGNCFCINFCVDGSTVLTDNPLFTHVGNFNITSALSPAGTTLAAQSGAGGVDYAFFGSVKLKGYATKKFPPAVANPLFYRFQYSVEGGPWAPITETHLDGDKLLVGVRQIPWNGSTTFQDIVIHQSVPASAPDSLPVSAPGSPPDHVLHLDADGWVRVDQRGIDNGFYGPLLWVNTAALVPGGDANSGETVGNAVVSPKNGKLVQIQYQTTDDPANPATFRTQVQVATIRVNNWSEVNLLRLEELFANNPALGCTPIQTAAHVKYTTDHEFLGEWSIGVWSNATGTVTGLPSGTGPRGNHSAPGGLDLATAALSPAFSSWPSCAYSLTLHTWRKLTNGEGNDQGKTNQILFCR